MTAAPKTARCGASRSSTMPSPSGATRNWHGASRRGGGALAAVLQRATNVAPRRPAGKAPRPAPNDGTSPGRTADAFRAADALDLVEGKGSRIENPNHRAGPPSAAAARPFSVKDGPGPARTTQAPRTRVSGPSGGKTSWPARPRGSMLTKSRRSAAPSGRRRRTTTPTSRRWRRKPAS